MNQSHYYILKNKGVILTFHGKLFLFADMDSVKAINEGYKVVRLDVEEIERMLPTYNWLVVILSEGVRYHYNLFPAIPYVREP